MRTLLLLAPLAAVIVGQCPSAAQGDGALAWRGCWEWSMPKKTPEDMVAIAATCQRLGFNVLMASPPKALTETLRKECHSRGIKLYRSTVFAGGEKAWQQVLSPEQQARFAQPRGEAFQQGGEPLSAEEIYSGDLPCWNRPEVHEHFAKMVTEYANSGVDGLAFDMVGYVNYHRCHCDVCEESLRQAREKDHGLSVDAWAEQVLVDFTNEMAQVARAANPDIELTAHLYPYFAPHPFYGYRLNIDHVGETVAWFFRPHWPLDKVRRQAEEVVGRQGTVWPKQTSAPFVGFYARPHRDFRSSTRVRREIEIIRESGAEAIQFAELGNLARKPAVAAAVAAALRQ